jgi:16S rRNA (adenine1518-N6/adenine1519-N6)-dimethyltransferase
MNYPGAAPKHQARKRFGQHFLHDQQVIGRIVDAIEPGPHDALIEIGPGLGALTRPLLQRAGRLEVIELDRDVIPHLTAACGQSPALKIHMADVLEVDFRALAGERLLRLCGNLPYNISTPLLFHVLQSRSVIRDMTFMLQKEVVLRMAAEPDTGDYGRLTVMLSAYCTSVRLFDVGPGAFRPPPKVDSSIVRVVPHASPPFAILDQGRFAAVVAAAFGQRRKTLRNSLSGVIDAAAFETTGINPGRRAETLSPAEFAALANAPSHPDLRPAS